MSFLSVDKYELVLDAKAIINLVTEVDAATKSGKTVEKALSDIIRNKVETRIKPKLIAALKKTSNKVGLSGIEALFEELKIVAEKAQESDRKIGWLAKEWSLETKNSASEKQYAFALSVEGDVYFGVQRLETISPEVSTRLHFGGKLSGTGSGKLIIPNGSVHATVDVGAGRSLEYHHAHKNPERLSGFALADSLELMPLPSDLKKVSDAFANGKLARLEKIVIRGSSGFGGNAGISAKFPTQYGTPGIDLSGEMRISDEFTCEITGEAQSNLVSVSYTGGSERANGLKLGVSYTVGLGTLLPEEARQLLAGSKKVHEVIVKIDDIANGFPDDPGEMLVTWLKPGDLVKSELHKLVGTALQSIKTKYGDDLTVLGGFARIVGLNDEMGANLSSDKVQNYIQGQVSELVADVLDENEALLQMSKAAISRELKSAFSTAFESELVRILDTETFSKIEPLIDQKLTMLAKHIDSKAAEFVVKLDVHVDGGISSTISKVKAFISQARTISKAVLDGVSRAQTDLLSAELAWQYAHQNHAALTYKAHFDVAEQNAVTPFRNAIVQPRYFAERTLAGPDDKNGVTILQSQSVRRLTKSKGHRWSVAFIGLPSSYSKESLTNLGLQETSDGVMLMTKQSITKNREFINESRMVSFVSAVNVLQAKGGNKTHSEATDVGSAASFGVSFEEKDGSVQDSEIRKLLSGFKTHGMIQDALITSIVEEVGLLRSEAKDRGRSKLKMSLKVALGVPADVAIELVRNSLPSGLGMTVDTERALQKATVLALAQHDQKRVSSAMRESSGNQTMEAMGLSSLEPRHRPEFEERVDFLNALQQSHETEEGYGIELSSSSRVLLGPKSTELIQATNALTRVMQLAADLYHNTVIPTPPLDPNEQKLYEEKLREFELLVRKRQEEINRIAGRFLRVGRPLPKWLDWLRGRKPERVITLFAALQSVIARDANVIPPLVITLKPEGGAPKSFIAPKPVH